MHMNDKFLFSVLFQKYILIVSKNKIDLAKMSRIIRPVDQKLVRPIFVSFNAEIHSSHLVGEGGQIWALKKTCVIQS